jgi:hypothetical protein
MKITGTQPQPVATRPRCKYCSRPLRVRCRVVKDDDGHVPMAHQRIVGKQFVGYGVYRAPAFCTDTCAVHFADAVSRDLPQVKITRLTSGPAAIQEGR